MEKYNFDKIIDRCNTNCVKYDKMEPIFGVKEAIPMWVADMDFATPDFILNAIRERMNHPILGYTFPGDGFYHAIQSWLKRRFNWSVARESIGFLAGIVPGLGHVLHTFTQPGDKVIIQTPVYMPFHWLPKNIGREVVLNHLKEEQPGHFVMDLQALEELFIQGAKTLILCNPHNPGGRVWTRQELSALDMLCERYDVLVIADEIHADLMFEGAHQIPYASVSKFASQHSVTLRAPSKTFNIAGLSTSYYIIENPVLKRQFDNYLASAELCMGTVFAYVATEAAYTQGEEWLEQCMAYIKENMQMAIDFFKKEIPLIKTALPEASYLLWLDCRDMGMEDEALANFFTKEARVVMNSGFTFGPGGEGRMRMNMACPRSIVLEALEQIKDAVNLLNK